MMKQYFFIFLLLATFNLSAQNFDIDLLKNINSKETTFKNNFFKADAQSVTVVNIVAPLSVLTVGYLKHDKKLLMNGVCMVAAYAVSSIVTTGAKHIFQRERPFNKYSFIVKRDEGGSYSFPSGHTSAAFCTATSLSLYFPKWYVIAPAYLWASSVGYARLYQGVHYPTDVLGGALVGAASAYATYKFQKHMDKKNLAKNKKTPNKAAL